MLILGLLSGTLTILLVLATRRYVRAESARKSADERAQSLESRFRAVTDIEGERARVEAELSAERDRLTTALEAERVRVASQIGAERATLEGARRELDLQRTAVEEAHRRAAAELEAQQMRALAKLESDRSEAERRIQSRRETAETEIRALETRLTELKAETVVTDERATLQSFGFYQKHYDFPTSAEFDHHIAEIERAQQEMTKRGEAALCTTTWIVEGSTKRGEQFTKRILSMMLRAFNGECDAAVARVKYNTIAMMEERIVKSAIAINKLGSSSNCMIMQGYIDLRLQELRAIHEQREKIQAEKEEQRQIRERIREEEIALREMEKARIEAERDEERYEAALVKARTEVETAQGAKHDKLLAKIAEMERRLAEAHENKERAISRAQQTRSGHVYVISNVGSFGEHVYKIGMTRRLDPFERIRELGDASVPFEFDIHAVIYADDAPGLEAELHRVFDGRRVNLVNTRKEFFYVSIDDIAREVRARKGDILITLAAEAEEYRKTSAMLSDRGESARGWGTYDRRSTPRS